MKIYDNVSGEATEFIECIACNGIGYHDVYYTEYDLDSVECLECDGNGIIELE